MIALCCYRKAIPNNQASVKENITFLYSVTNTHKQCSQKEMLMAVSLHNCAGHVFQDYYLSYHPIIVTDLICNHYHYKSFPEETAR